jgi:lipopolysaccharide/colanic/teichoic acid biosynthesis glycosyltransferase
MTTMHACLTRQRFSPMAKRAFDLLLALAGLVLLFPILVLVALLIKVDSGGPILFRQERVGLGGVPFRIFKFRTMQVDAEEQGSLTIGNDPRVTRAGCFLRRYKLDELPQLFDVVLGQMSLVGPRPEVREYFELYPPDAQQAMISLRPGITGPSLLVLFNESELLGRSADPHRTYTSELIPIKARYIVQYAAHNSVLGDIRIIFCTLRKVVSRWNQPTQM